MNTPIRRASCSLVSAEANSRNVCRVDAPIDEDHDFPERSGASAHGSKLRQRETKSAFCWP